MFQLLDVLLFAFLPRRFWIGVRIGAARDHVSNAFSKTATYFFQHRNSAAVFHYVVQKSRNGKIFVAPRFEDQRRNAHQMRDVRNGRGLSYLFLMFLKSELEGA